MYKLQYFSMISLASLLLVFNTVHGQSEKGTMRKKVIQKQNGNKELKITKKKKFLIGMFTMDTDNVYKNRVFDIPVFMSDKKYTSFNDLAVGNDNSYLAVLKEYNFNCVWPVFQLVLPVKQYVTDKHLPDRGFLDRALKIGLDVIVSAPDFDVSKRSKKIYKPGQAKKAIEYWSDHPAVIGFSVMDEPSYLKSVNETNFTNIKLVSEDIRKYSTKLPFVNILPLWAPKHYFEYGEWKEPKRLFTDKEFSKDWLDPYIEICKPDFLMFEYYLFADGEVSKNCQTNYFRNLHVISRKAVENKMGFIYLTCPWFSYRKYPYRVKNTNMCRYSLFSALTYGVSGILYWAREFSPSPNKHYLPPNSWDVRMEQSTKEALKKIHKKINDNSEILLSLNFINCYHVSNLSTIWYNCREKLPEGSAWDKFSDDNNAKKYFNLTDPFVYKSGAPIESLAISFLRDDKNSDYFWIFNKNIYNFEGIDFILNFNKNVELSEIFAKTEKNNVKELNMHLDPGEAKLFRISAKNK